MDKKKQQQRKNKKKQHTYKPTLECNGLGNIREGIYWEMREREKEKVCEREWDRERENKKRCLRRKENKNQNKKIVEVS